jgi:hypothetical protein
MFKHMIAGITALSLTLATAAPVQANGFDREDVGKLLIGIAALAALNAAIQNNNRNDRADAQTQTADHRSNRANSWADLNRPHQRDRDRARNRALPRECLRSVETRFGTQRLFGKRCLERNYARVNRLPNRCAVRVFTTDGPRNGFDPSCLREQGFRATRRN